MEKEITGKKNSGVKTWLGEDNGIIGQALRRKKMADT